MTKTLVIKLPSPIRGASNYKKAILAKQAAGYYTLKEIKNLLHFDFSNLVMF